MTLPLSGPISMQDVNVELSQSSTGQAALNDANVRSLFQIPSGTISLSDGYGKSAGGGSANWILSIGNASTMMEVLVSAADSSGNLYSLAKYTHADIDGVILKHGSDGQLSWSKRIVIPSGAYFGDGNITIDINNNIYVVGIFQDGAIGKSFLLKLNSSATILWQKVFTNLTPTDTALYYSVDTDSTGDVYVAGSFYASNSQAIVAFSASIMKMSGSSGAMSWHQCFDLSFPGITIADYVFAYYIKVDKSSGDIYISGKYDKPSYDVNQFYLKTDSSGAFINGETFPDATGSEPSVIELDSSSNIYIGHLTQTPGGPFVVLNKYNSSNVLQWQKEFVYDPPNENYSFGPKFKVFGSALYAYALNSENNTLELIKCDLNGNILFQRSINTYCTTNARLMAAFGSDFYMNGSTDSFGDYGFIAKLPIDGSKTGTYSPYVYSTTSLTVLQNSSYAISNLNFSTFSASEPANDQSLSLATQSFTQSIVTV